MKRLFTLLLLGSSLAGWAQQVNGSFDETWEDCTPYTGGISTTCGTQPQGWKISHIAGYNFFGVTWIGSTKVASSTTGYNDQGLAVQLTNTANESKKDQIIPAYLTLGTPWNTANLSGQEADGGSFGGLEFSNKPDAIEFYYKRSATDAEPASVVAYLWSGTYSQANVPVNVANSPKTITMTNRDRNILGITTNKGGTVTETGNLIAVINNQITNTTEEWTKYTAQFEYKDTETTPEKINIILAANDYFSANRTVTEGNSLTVDEVTLIYYHTLSALSYDGKDINFEESTLTYDLSDVTYEADKLHYTKKAAGGTAVATYDETTAKVSIVVTSDDKLNSATYELQFKMPVSYTGKLSSISYNGTPLEGFAEDTHYYSLTADYTADCLTATASDEGLTPTISYDAKSRIATISVPESGQDINYYVKFAKEATHYPSKLLISCDMLGGFLSAPAQEVGITENEDGTIGFQLIGFEFTGANMGDIYVNDIAMDGDGNIYKEDVIQIFGDFGVLLGDLPITLKGQLEDGELECDLDITWTNEGYQYPIKVTVYPPTTPYIDARGISGLNVAAVQEGLTNPNCIIYTDEGTTVAEGSENVVVGKSCTKLKLNKSNDISIPYAFTATEASLARSFATGWHSICLPFATTPETLGAEQAQAFTAFDGNTLTFEQVTAMEANVPYLIYFAKETENISLQNIDAAVTVPKSVTHGNVTFTGNYEAGRDMEGLYGVAEKDGAQYIMRGGAGSTLGSTGAYFTVSGSEVNSLHLRLDGIETSISGVQTGQDGQAFDIYSLNGIKVRSQAATTDGLPKGIYLINGKKHIVK